jgi:hypothetical protein
MRIPPGPFKRPSDEPPSELFININPAEELEVGPYHDPSMLPVRNPRGEMRFIGETERAVWDTNPWPTHSLADRRRKRITLDGLESGTSFRRSLARLETIAAPRLHQP